jgi:hypothetical protein
MKTFCRIVRVLLLALLAGCCPFWANSAQAGTWSAPNYFSTGTYTVSSGGNTTTQTVTNTGEISGGGSGQVSATLQAYGVMIYSASPGDPYPLPCPPVNTVQYTLSATAEEEGHGSNTPHAAAFNGQQDAAMMVSGGYFGYTATADITGTYNFRNYTLTQDTVNNRWILTGPKMDLSADYGGGADIGKLDIKMSGMTWN